ncbi:hypothetical protein H9638_04275 [Arthrobacter sp. Sa2BUA2]|uniref:MinD-like ATPase involved in chromosome partitioning or flagellar assembly n=1 Tax=Arthrobacter pullicola TaxID=2762224 RepID=A0ABR8YFP6_9MICC|nr:hypothetical protein [Arthrobacter pullicola]MBD8043023.1 hypothetical protein [Arthrobacter pullicola]
MTSTDPGAGFGAPAPVSPDGFESTPQRLRRTLRTRPAEGPARRVFQQAADMFRGDDYPQSLAEAAAGVQQPVTTGRRIAVIGSRGGAGRTTAAALLARTFASLRADAAAAVDLTEAGTLALRLGAPEAPPLDAAAARLGRTIPGSLADLRGFVTSPGPENLLVTGRRAFPGTQTATDDDALHLSRVLSRYCPVTLFDCPPGLGGLTGQRDQVRWALQEAHLALYVTPASVAGLDDAALAAELWRRDPALTGVPLLVLLTRTSPRSPFNLAAEARRLSRSGVDTAVLGYDAHLAAGVEIQPRLLSRAARLQGTQLAAHVLSAASAAPGMPARPAAARRADTGSGTGRRARA